MLNLPLPAEEPADVISNGATYRLFDYRDGASAVVFLLMLVLLVGLPLCGALLAGFTVARERAASTPVLAAAWGALVGPVWAITLALLNALLQDTLLRPRPGRERVRDRARPRRARRRARGLPRGRRQPVGREPGRPAPTQPSPPAAA